jgi:hypothetical protein
MRAAHLSRRFFGSLRAGPPRRADVQWVGSVLQPGELGMWRRLSNADRRHSIRVARRVDLLLSVTPNGGDDRWLAAALLHDVGKLDARLGTLGRVGATLAGAAAGHERAKAWSSNRGIARSVGLYLRHAELGERRLRATGAREEAARWAGAHHDTARRDALAFPAHVIEALIDADDD